jgi:hypothetical protein
MYVCMYAYVYYIHVHTYIMCARAYYTQMSMHGEVASHSLHVHVDSACVCVSTYVYSLLENVKKLKYMQTSNIQIDANIMYRRT